jgi:outer membrane protein assembly factor BamE (lipoprotein component of BamABCDE complex)
MKKIFAICCLIIAAAACTFQTKHRGYVFPENLEAEIASVKTTAGLEDKLGSPQVKTVYGDQVWVYYGADENYHGPFPVTYDNRTVLLAWVSGGKITKTKILRDADLPDVEPAPGETQIPAAIELNALQELFNNVGRFTPAGLGQ